MKLKHPNTDIDFAVTPAYFVGCFDIYDREDSLGEYLNQFDPNDISQLESILDELFFNGAEKRLLIGHKYELLRILGEALSENNFDFQSLLISNEESDEYFTLPRNWNIRDPKLFFENIYFLAKKKWQEKT